MITRTQRRWAFLYGALTSALHNLRHAQDLAEDEEGKNLLANACSVVGTAQSHYADLSDALVDWDKERKEAGR